MNNILTVHHTFWMERQAEDGEEEAKDEETQKKMERKEFPGVCIQTLKHVS